MGPQPELQDHKLGASALHCVVCLFIPQLMLLVPICTVSRQRQMINLYKTLDSAVAGIGPVISNCKSSSLQ